MYGSPTFYPASTSAGSVDPPYVSGWREAFRASLPANGVTAMIGLIFSYCTSCSALPRFLIHHSFSLVYLLLFTLSAHFTSYTMSPTMKAVVFHGPGKVVVEDRPIPQIQDPKEIIVKVEKTALCGSELHVYRGHQPSPTGFIMGHEFTGVVEETGKEVKTLKKGERVVCPFTVSW